MYRDHSIAIVVPAYNEAGFVGDVLETIPDFVDRVYAVDDRSTDETWAEIRRHASCEPVEPTREVASPAAAGDGSASPAARSDGGERTATVAAPESIPVEADEDARGRRDASVPIETPNAPSADDDADGPTIVPVRHAENRGVGAAITTGYRLALADGMDVTAVMAGDGQMDPAYLPRLLDPIVEGRADYAKGNRLRGRDHRASMSTFRFGGNVLLSLLTKVASGYWRMLDPQNGYTAISGAALETIDLDSLYTGYGFSNDLLVELNAREFAVADVTMPAVYGDERSHIAYRSFVPRLSWLLWRRFVHRLGVRYVLRDFHPLVGLYALGIGGLAVAAGAVASRLVGARTAESRSTDGDRRPAPETRDGGATDPSAGVGERSSIRWWLAGLWAFLSAVALCLAMAFDHDENEGAVVTDE